MIRFFLRRIPRFGFVTLFAAMLLFVSVAGWAKWNLDLWREEEALLADIAEAGFDVTCRRSLTEPVDTALLSQPWTPPPAWYAPIVERFSRIEEIRLRNSAPEELLERAARLPYVRSVAGDGRRDPSVATEAIAEIAGIDVAPLPTPDRSVELPPLPRGESVQGDAKLPLIAKFVEALTADRRPSSERGTMYIVSWKDERLLTATDGETTFSTCEGHVWIETPRSGGGYLVETAGFRQVSRQDDPSSFRTDARAYSPLRTIDLGQTFLETVNTCGFEAPFRTSLDDAERISVERIDDERYRFDLPAFVVKFTSAPCEDSYVVSMIARSDLDWEVESWDIRGSRTGDVSNVPPLYPVASLSCRGVLRRERDCVVPESWTVDRPMVAGRAPHLPNGIQPLRDSSVAHYDFMSNVDLSHVTPETFDAKMLPPRRTLPWLRWHRVTFAMSLGLFAFVVVRKLLARRRAAEAPTA